MVTAGGPLTPLSSLNHQEQLKGMHRGFFFLGQQSHFLRRQHTPEKVHVFIFPWHILIKKNSFSSAGVTKKQVNKLVEKRYKNINWMLVTFPFDPVRQVLRERRRGTCLPG